MKKLSYAFVATFIASSSAMAGGLNYTYEVPSYQPAVKLYQPSTTNTVTYQAPTTTTYRAPTVQSNTYTLPSATPTVRTSAPTYTAPAITVQKAPAVRTVQLEQPKAVQNTVTKTKVVEKVVNTSSLESERTGLDITLGGFMDFQAGVNPYDFINGNQGNEHAFRNDTEIHFKISAETDRGLEYGAVIELEGDVSSDARNDGFNADKTFLYVENKAGRFELGGVEGAETRLAVSSANIQRGTGGTSGDFHHFLAGNNTAYTTNPVDTIIKPGSVSYNVQKAGFNNELDATKVSYYSPSINGLQFGLSFAPQSNSVGQNIFNPVADVRTQENLVQIGALYSRIINELAGTAIHASLTGEFGSGKGANEDRSAWALGLGIDHKGLSVAGSYGSHGDLDATRDGEYYDLAIAYEIAGIGASLGYFASEIDDSTNANGVEFENISLGLDYNFAAGIAPYLEFNFVDFTHDNAAFADRDGIITLAGIELSF